MNNKHKINSGALIKVYIFITVISIMLGNIKIARARTSAAGAHAAVYYKAQSAATRISNSMVGKWGSAKWENKAKKWQEQGQPTNRRTKQRKQQQGGGEKPATKPGKWQGRANKNSTEKGDIYWQPTLHMWSKCTQLEKQLGKLHTIGSDLWYKNPPAIKWKNLQGLIVGLNMRGWGDQNKRAMLWNMLARTHTMIAVLTDHRQHTNTQRKQMEEEITRGWTGQG